MRRSSLPLPILLLAFGLAPAAAAGQHPPTSDGPVEGLDFRVYDGGGRARSFAEILAALDAADVLLVGETHDDATGHAVEAEILARAAQRVGRLGDAGAGRSVVLSLEMFERDVQYILDEYLEGLITEDQFKSSARPWDRYDTDYRPMVEFARAHDLPVVAANAPRRYVNRVSRLGPASLEQLPARAKAFLPPLPYPGPSETYTRQWNALMEEMRAAVDSADAADGARKDGQPTDDRPTSDPVSSAPRHDMGNALHAQALWDAAMAHAVAGALQRHAGALVVHYAGSFHVQWGTGIPEKLLDYGPGARVVTVVLEPTRDVNAWDDEEHGDLGDFVILTSRPDEGAPAG